MGFFDKSENIEEYLRMSEGYDGFFLVEKLKEYLTQESSVLELGMGPGKDLLLLSEYYHVTGSDLSPLFIDMFRKDHPQTDLCLLDAVSIKTDKTFDAIYSNKVLHHLSREELALSFLRQLDVLNPGGMVLHSFWLGDREEFYDDLRFVYYRPEDLRTLIPGEFSILHQELYKEFEKDDSFFLIIQK